MTNQQTSALWLSDDMAHALAAMCPPLETTDVMQAADKFAAGNSAVQVLNQLLCQGANLMVVRRVIEALHALRDARVTDSSLAAWLLRRESNGEADVPNLVAAAERVLQKLAPSLSQLVSSRGTHALLARSLHVARADFPFLEAARAGAGPDAWLLGLSTHIQNVDLREANRGLQAILGVLLDLLAGFIGEDLTLNLVREVWSDLPAGELTPTRYVRRAED